MTIEVTIRDINGAIIKEGSRVCAYEQRYAEVSRDESGPVPIVEVDISRPMPIKDVPLFIGRVRWSHEHLAFEIAIEKMLVDWVSPPCSVRMGGGSYAFELMEDANLNTEGKST